jgi:hypothetical protein
MFISRSGLMAMPIHADGLFPKVCVDKEFSYENANDPMTKLHAIKDAEEAFRLYSSCRYFLPANFSAGIEKVSIVMGETVDRENVRRLRRELEENLGLRPVKPPSHLCQAAKRALKILGM